MSYRVHISYSHDGLNRLLEERYLGGQLTSIESGFDQAKVDFRYGYDRPSEASAQQKNVAGQMASLRVFPGATYHYSYDKNGNRNLEQLNFYDRVIQMKYQFDLLGRMQALEYPDASVYTLAYDPDDGLLDSIKDIVPKIEYSPYNDPISMQILRFHQNNTFDDTTGVMLSKSLTSPSQLVQRNYDEYDVMGRIVRVSGRDVLFGRISRSFSYGDAGRLESSKTQYLDPKGNWSAQDKANSYAYDNFGRLLASEWGSLSYNDTSETRSIRIANQVWSFDAAGRLIEAPNGRKVHWKSPENLACFTDGAGPELRIETLPDGSRFTEVKRSGGIKHSRLYFNKYAQYDHESKQWTKFIFTDRDPTVTIKGSDARVVFRDPLGTAEAEASDKGVSAYAIHYPFGSLLWESTKAEWQNNYRYTGSLMDSDFEFYQMKARFYDPRLGQFISKDGYFWAEPGACLKSPMECNLYSYARNNPLKYVDPSGKQSQEQQIMNGMFVDQVKTEVKGAFVAAWTTAVEIPYKIAGNLAMGFDVGNVAGKDISGLASARDILARDGTPVQSLKDGISALPDSSGTDKLTSGLSLFAAPVTKIAGLAIAADTKHLFDTGLIGESMKDTGEQFAKYLNDFSKVSEVASKVNDYIGATLGVGNSVDSLNRETSPK